MVPTVKLVAVDDTPAGLELLAEALQQDGLAIFTSTDPEEGLELIYREHPQIVLLDLVMPKMSGLEMLERIVEFDPAIDVILMTAHYTTETAVEAIQKGACDYLNKPVSIPALRGTRGETSGGCAAKAARRGPGSASCSKPRRFEGMIGRSPLMWELFARIRRVARHYRSALITGPTGTGKDLVARALHNLSPATSGRFVTCNCSAVVETLFESELFGYVKGAFTGANTDKMGLVEFAHGGTLFLDEIGDMPLTTQAKLLRVLQNQEITRVGSVTPRKVDVRVIAATNRDVQEMIAQKQFREDLYYRLAMVELKTPALAERKEDLPLLEKFLLDRFSDAIRQGNHRHHAARADPTGAAFLAGQYPRTGKRAGTCLHDDDERHDRRRGSAAVHSRGRKRSKAAEASALSVESFESSSSFEAHEKELLAEALEKAGGNQSEAARILRISRDRMRYKMAKHNLR